ncbi:2Fe-2S ferredoxin [Rosa chinensis]|uniref:2Fe-2S ferredoxin n=1 Tax=Rosa chinensis TaxID=74649 RepID=UPI000D08E5CE|nr:2Fe-2S ferredoxin [Rosa chinensis]XP_024185462.1 2Fe-2S ferredoxin [Rosa chinensis]
MVVSRFSGLGRQMIKYLRKGPLTFSPKAGNLCASYNYFSHTLTPRTFSTTTAHEEGNKQIEEISVIFVDNDGEKHVKVPVGKSILEAAHENDIELEGACEGSCACSTCHVIVRDLEYYNKLEDPTDEENDMLDLAFGLTETSRLGCQVIATPELDGICLELPAATRNFAVDKYAKAT